MDPYGLYGPSWPSCPLWHLLVLMGPHGTLWLLGPLMDLLGSYGPCPHGPVAQPFWLLGPLESPAAYLPHLPPERVSCRSRQSNAPACAPCCRFLPCGFCNGLRTGRWQNSVAPGPPRCTQFQFPFFDPWACMAAFHGHGSTYS